MTTLPATHPLRIAGDTLKKLGIRYDANLSYPISQWVENRDNPATPDDYRERVIRSLANGIERNGDAQVALIGRKTTISDPYELTVEMAETFFSAAEKVRVEAQTA